MFSKYIGNFVRHALTGLGGVLIYVGVDSAATESFVEAAVPVVTGVLAYVAGQAASIAKDKLKERF